MSARFIVKYIDDLTSKQKCVADLNRRHNDDFGYVIWDTEKDEFVGCDIAAPEDKSFTRDYAWVPHKLNELDTEIKRLDALVKSLQCE